MTTTAPSSPTANSDGPWCLGRIIFQLRGVLLLLISTPIIAALVRSLPLNLWAFILGTSLCVSGVVLRLYSIRRIGKKARVRQSNPRLVVDSGPYGRMRNPLYVANLSMLAGIALCLTEPWVAMLVAGLGFTLYGFVVWYEEGRLHQLLGTEYAVYCNSVPRWIPKMRVQERSNDDAYTWAEVLSREKRLIPGISVALIVAASLRFGWIPLATWLQSFGLSEDQLTRGVGITVALAVVIDAIIIELKRRRRQRKRSAAELLEQSLAAPPAHIENRSSETV